MTTSVAANCLWCGEPVLEGEQTDAISEPAHRECFTRMICGSIAHIEKRCSCFVPGSTESDPPELTRRESARAAWQRWREYYLGENREAAQTTTSCMDS